MLEKWLISFRKKNLEVQEGKGEQEKVHSLYGLLISEFKKKQNKTEFLYTIIIQLLIFLEAFPTLHVMSNSSKHIRCHRSCIQYKGVIKFLVIAHYWSFR